jgi:hypothetical protein
MPKKDLDFGGGFSSRPEKIQPPSMAPDDDLRNDRSTRYEDLLDEVDAGHVKTQDNDATEMPEGDDPQMPADDDLPGSQDR